METVEQYTQQDIEENKFMALLSYLGILVLIPLLTKKDSPYTKFHVKQGIVLLIAWVVLALVSWIPVLGWIIGIIGFFVLVVFFIMGVINSLSGQAKPLPLIGQFAEKINI